MCAMGCTTYPVRNASDSPARGSGYPRRHLRPASFFPDLSLCEGRGPPTLRVRLGLMFPSSVRSDRCVIALGEEHRADPAPPETHPSDDVFTIAATPIRPSKTRG